MVIIIRVYLNLFKNFLSFSYYLFYMLNNYYYYFLLLKINFFLYFALFKIRFIIIITNYISNFFLLIIIIKMAFINNRLISLSLISCLFVKFYYLVNFNFKTFRKSKNFNHPLIQYFFNKKRFLYYIKPSVFIQMFYKFY